MSNEKLSASLEDYLERIHRIVAEKRVARPRDIGRALGVNGSSVTGALRMLAEHGLIHYAPYEFVTLTPSGERAAHDVCHRHEVLRRFLAEVLGIKEAVADSGACRMEHSIPPNVLRKLVLFVDFVQNTPGGGKLLDQFRTSCEGAPVPARQGSRVRGQEPAGHGSRGRSRSMAGDADASHRTRAASRAGRTDGPGTRASRKAGRP